MPPDELIGFSVGAVEGEGEGADLHPRALVQYLRLGDAHAVEEGAVGRAEVLKDHVAGGIAVDARVAPRDQRIGQAERRLRIAPDQRHHAGGGRADRRGAHLLPLLLRRRPARPRSARSPRPHRQVARLHREVRRVRPRLRRVAAPAEPGAWRLPGGLWRIALHPAHHLRRTLRRGRLRLRERLAAHRSLRLLESAAGLRAVRLRRGERLAAHRPLRSLGIRRGGIDRRRRGPHRPLRDLRRRILRRRRGVLRRGGRRGGADGIRSALGCTLRRPCAVRVRIARPPGTTVPPEASAKEDAPVEVETPPGHTKVSVTESPPLPSPITSVSPSRRSCAATVAPFSTRPFVEFVSWI